MRKIVLEFNASKSSLKQANIWEFYCCEQSELKNFGNWHFFPNSSEVKVRLLIFCSEQDIKIISAFLWSEYLLLKSASPPPLRIKWSSPSLHLQPHIISTITLLYFPFHAYKILLFPYGYIMNNFAKLVKWTNQYITLSNNVIIIKSITLCNYFARS